MTAVRRAVLPEWLEELRSQKNMTKYDKYSCSCGIVKIVENEYPWLCSLTYNNNHICGITLLSGPPHQTILAGAAHCYSPGDSTSSYRVGISTINDINNITTIFSRVWNTNYLSPNEQSTCNGYYRQVTCGEHSLRSRDDHEVVLQVIDVIVHPRWWNQCWWG